MYIEADGSTIEQNAPAFTAERVTRILREHGHEGRIVPDPFAAGGKVAYCDGEYFRSWVQVRNWLGY